MTIKEQMEQINSEIKIATKQRLDSVGRVNYNIADKKVMTGIRKYNRLEKKLNA